jgi:predicted RNase H-like HicB family nuclease
VLSKARAIARTYRLVIEEDPDAGYAGSTVEMPLVMGGGRTVQACARDVLEATAATIANMLEKGDKPPAPASEGKRDRQVNLRLTAEEKFRMEQAARREGFRGLSDFIRSHALRAAE